MTKQLQTYTVRTDEGAVTRSDLLYKVLIVFLSVATLFVGGLLAYSQSERLRETEQLRLKEDRLQYESVLEHVEEYFDAVHTLLLYIRSNKNVKLLSDSAIPFVQEVYDFQWNRHRLSEVYIVERDFDGTKPPRMTFEHGIDEQTVEEVHSLEREEEEYKLLIEQMHAFVSDPGLEAKIGEANLCVDEPGLVYSLPIHHNGELVGIVCGMMPKSRLVVELLRGQSSKTTVIVDSDFQVVCDIDPSGQEWLKTVRREFAGGESLSNKSKQSVSQADGGRTIIAPLKVISDDRFWLIYKTNDPLTNNLLYIWGPSISLTGIGLILIILVLILRRRHRDNLNHIIEADQTRRRHEGILSTSLDGFWMTSTQGEIIQVNDSFCRLTGYSKEQLRQMKITDLVDQSNTNNFTRILLGVVEEDSVQMEVSFLRKDGSTVEMEMSANYLSLDQGVIFAFVRDISERKRVLAELASHKESLSRAQEIAQLGNWDWDVANNEVSWSVQMYHIYGLGPDTKPSIDAVRNLVHSEDLTKFDRVIDIELNSDERLKPFEFRIIRPDGEVRTVLAISEAVYDDAGKLIRTSGTAQDITERKKAEQALESSERLLRRTVESTADGILVVNEAGKAIMTNSRFAQMWRIPDQLLQAGDDDKLLGHVLHQLIDPEAFVARVKELYGSTRDDLDTLHFKDGRVFERFSAPLADESGGLGRVWSFRDITERQQAEDHVREINRQLMGSIENMPIAYILWDSEKRLLEWNFAAERIFGYTKEEMQGKHPFEVLAPERLRVHTDEMTRDLLAGEPSAYFERENNRRKDGSLISCRWHNQPLKDDKGNVFAVLSMAEDVTSRIEAEEKLHRSESRLRQLTELLPEAIFETDIRGYFTLANQKAYEYFGYDKNDVSHGLHALKLITSKDRRRARESFKQVMAAEVVGPIEVTAQKRDGGHFEMILHCTAIVKDGKVLGMRGVAVDITSRKQIELDLQKSERRYRDQSDFLQEVIESLSHPFYVIEASSYRILMANSATGQTNPCEGVTCHLAKFGLAKPCSGAGHICSLKKVVATGKPVRHERSVKGKDGSIRCLEIHGYPIFDDEGKVTKIIEYSHDITERKRIEKDLKRLAEYPESNPSPIFTLNKSAGVVYKNPAAQDLLKELKVATEDLRTILPENIESIIADCSDRGQTVINVEASFGNRTWLWNFHPTHEQGTIHCFATEITDRLDKERESRKLWAAVVQSRSMICITDQKGIVEYVNPAFERTTGFTSEESIGKDNANLNWGKLDKDTHRELMKVISSGNNWQGKINGYKKNGQSYWERQSISPVFDDQENIIGYLMVGEDITDETDLQTKLAESDKMSAVGILAAGVAHEFKNYLAGMIGNATFALDVLEDETVPDILRQTLGDIVEIGEKANEIAMSLLTYSRASTEDLVEENLVIIIKRSIKLMQKEANNLNIEIVTDLDENLKAVVSAGKIQQLFLNLLINALHAIKSNGVISIILTSEGKWAKIIVADTGCGISETDLKRIFDPFFSTKGVWGQDKVAGTGMGLSICGNIAREFGGSLEVESKVGAGTSMILLLPLSLSNSSDRGTLFGHRPDGLPQVLLMSLSEETRQSYTKAAQTCSAGLTIIDSVQKLSMNLHSVADVVICDAHYCAKLELYRLADICQQLGIPYVTINCDRSGGELGELYDDALANYKGLGDLRTILEKVTAKISSRTLTHG